MFKTEVLLAGDPKKVNLFGESAGAASIVAHMVAPDSRSLFRNGILQSGSLDNPWAMDRPPKALSRSLIITQKVGCYEENMTATIQCLRDTPAEALDTAMWAVTSGYLEFPLVIVSRDEAGFFPKDAYQALRDGDYRATDIMIGINQDEGTFWMAYYEMKKHFHPFDEKVNGQEKLINANQFTECVSDIVLKDKQQTYKSAVLWEYHKKDKQCQQSDNGAFYRNQLNQLIGDYYFTCDSLWLADEVVKRNKGRVYVYHFEQRIGNNPWPEWMGVMHGYEIEYIFGLPLLNASHHKNFVNGKNHHTDYNYTQEDKQFSKEIIQYWTSFASTG